jgi:DNA-binding NtrC family response regulator
MAVVLVVEDEVQLLILAETVLQRAGYETLSASTPAEADAVIHSENKVDLIFTDLGLGDQAEAGLELGQSASHARPGIPLLYTSGRTLSDGMKSLFSEPCAFLSKPYKDHDLIHAVAELLRLSQADPS